MEPLLYRLNAGFARYQKHLVYFSAVKLAETEKAVYLYGHGTTESKRFGVCCACARPLTHPVSVELGIGPECGRHYHDWNLVGGYNHENIERLKGILVSIKMDSWIPKSAIIETFPTEENIVVPENHPIVLKQIERNTPKVIEEPQYPRYADLSNGPTNNSLQVIKIVFPFNFDDLDKVKTLPERKFIANEKCWICSLDADNIKLLQKWGFHITDILLSKLKMCPMPDPNMPIKPVEIPNLNLELFPFQKIGVSFLESRHGRALIADEMGLGKTVQALAWLQLHPELRPAVIVAPASLKLNWEKEAHTWMKNPKCQILSGTKPFPTHGEILIINYDIVSYWEEYLIKKKMKVIVMDEVHCIKNSATKRTKAIKKIAKGIPHVIGLSGTPIVNRPIELFNALTLIDSTVIPNFREFTHKYCGAKFNGYGWDYTGATNTEELHRKLTNTIMIRRKKSEVLTELPSKMKSFVPMELSNQDVYDHAESDFIEFLKTTKGLPAAERASNAKALAEIEGLKQIALQGKIEQCIEWVEDFLDTDQKLVVFAVHKTAIDMLTERFNSISVKIDGSVSMSARNDAVNKFQNDPKCKLFIGNIQAAGVGLTLTTASNVAFIELPWTPGALVQAEDRCHRIGQKDSVTAHYLLAHGTIEEKIALLLDKKKIVLDSVLDGEKTEKLSLLTELMNAYLI